MDRAADDCDAMTKLATSTLSLDRSAHSLGRGIAGTALLHIERAHLGQGSWATAHEYVASMTSVPIEVHRTNSLFSGAPAVAYVLHTAGRTAYAKALSTLDNHIERITRDQLHHAHERIDRGQLPALREFDLISGLTGLGAYQLRRHGGGDLLKAILSYLVRLCEPIILDGRELPGWWTSNDTADLPSDHCPGGHGNLGMAHGITGPLTLMACASRRGVQVSGQNEAIQTICAWLDQWRHGIGLDAWWPGTVALHELEADALRHSGPQRPSWCYGTPGIARAQQLAGIALGDQALQRLAESALIGCITDDTQLDQLGDASLCHGWAGVVQTTWRSAADAGPHSALTSELAQLTSRLDTFARAEGARQDAELMEGISGVHLVQITTASNVHHTSAWDGCLLLDG